MRLLGIDYGTKRIGLALSDKEGTVATPYAVLENTSNAVRTITDIITREGVEAVVIGESINYKGEENPIMKDIRAVAALLENTTGIPVHFEPEVLTTQHARRGQEEIGILDASAAALITNSFIERHESD